MSSYNYINKENSTVNSASLKSKIVNNNVENRQFPKKMNLKDGFGNPEGGENQLKPKITLVNSQQVERIPLGGKVVNNNNNRNDQGSRRHKKNTLKRTNSLFLDQELKKKIQVQKDESNDDQTEAKSKINVDQAKKTSPLKRRRVKSRESVENSVASVTEKLIKEPETAALIQSFSEDEYELEYVPDIPEPLEYVPDNCPSLSESDLQFFRTKNPVPRKNSSKEIDEELNRLIKFDTIPEIDISVGFSDDEGDTDSLVKKQPRLLSNCDLKLDKQNIPNLHFDAGNKSPFKRSFSDLAHDDDEVEEGLSYQDLESLIM